MDTKAIKGFGNLSVQETIDLAQGLTKGPRGATSAAVKTGIAAAQYMYGYPLEEPSKKLYFIEDALRRRIPRKVNPTGGIAAHWKIITGVNSGKIKAGVAEGAINTAVTLATSEKSASYRTLNMYNTYTDESKFFGRNFEDIPELGMLVTLQNEMIQEDRYLLGGTDVTIGAPATVVAADSGAVGTFAAVPYYIVVSALTVHGYLNVAKGRISGTDAVDESIGTPNTGGTVTPTASHGMTIYWADVPGAFAYNVYIGTSSYAAATYRGTVTTNLVTYTSPTAAGTGVTNLADQTADQYGYEGLIQQLTALTGTVGSTGSYGTMSAYYKDNAGVAPTSDGAGGCVELETLLQSIWNNYRISPTVLFLNSQEAKSLKKLSIGSSTANAVRIVVTPDGKNEFGAGSAVNAYWNPYTAQWIDIITSVHMAPGKLMALGETVPYPNAETPNNFEVELQQEYYGEMFARTSRITPVGVTCIGALKVYLPGACGIIANLAPA
jgi:hypothetical protein